MRDVARIAGQKMLSTCFLDCQGKQHLSSSECGYLPGFARSESNATFVAGLLKSLLCSTITLILTTTPSLAAQLRVRLEHGPAFGTFVKLGRREVIEILAAAGLHFVICDLEHSQISEQEAGNLILAGRACGLPVVVRIADFNPGLANRLLECGAAGIQVPQIQSQRQAAEIRRACKYPPEGSRSISLAQPAAGYGAEELNAYIQRSNQELLLIGQLESKELEQPLAGILRELDIAFIGTLDLTVDMGVAGKLDDAQVQQRLREIEGAAAAAKVPLGIYADSPARAAQAAAAGYRFIALSSDLGALSSSAKGWTRQLSELTSGAASKT